MNYEITILYTDKYITIHTVTETNKHKTKHQYNTLNGYIFNGKNIFLFYQYDKR
jgi:hypothetical protein